MAPCCFVGARTLRRTDGRFDFPVPVGLATDAWIADAPRGAFAAAVRTELACLGVTVCESTALLVPLATQDPLGGSGSLMNLASANRVFDALFRWCD